ncbi:unnamed protein product [marine sediment metagenome]|uniref:Uncharacterized protein n=1 Tax=marine sediment metagenome TaxID=412755 RepID=X1MB29_9ZZZZ
MTQLQVQSPLGNLLVGIGASVPLGASGIVTAWGRNDMITDQKLGIAWTIADPDGIVVEEYSRWEAFATAPGGEQDFIGGRFDINKPGTWRIRIDLIMNLDSPVVVDTYDGVLCVVTEVFAGTITRKELKYDTTVGEIPVY